MNKSTFKTLLRTSAFASIIIMPVVLGGCAMHQSSLEPSMARNKITVAESVERMELYVQKNALNLSMRDQDAMGGFLAEYAKTGQGQLYLNIPSNAANGAGVSQAKDLITRYMAGMGVGTSSMQIGQYQARSDAPAPVIVSYRKLAAVPINCHQGASLTQTGNNQAYSGFGCAQTANLAALVSNPRHLLSPADSGYGPSARGVMVLGKYNKNEATGTPKPSGQEVSAESK